MSDVVVAALYKFVTLEDFHELREPLLDACVKAGTLGTLLLAREGINGTFTLTSARPETAIFCVGPNLFGQRSLLTR